jgi:hypothetical protein
MDCSKLLVLSIPALTVYSLGLEGSYPSFSDARAARPLSFFTSWVCGLGKTHNCLATTLWRFGATLADAFGALGFAFAVFPPLAGSLADVHRPWFLLLAGARVLLLAGARVLLLAGAQVLLLAGAQVLKNRTPVRQSAREGFGFICARVDEPELKSAILLVGQSGYVRG